ncbi:hypothetical protein BDY24DRAFT_372466 [Mrakia frigida]|uniref:uncharacterized protein n=1 Tax=Mrakia frigida TaxID=29902 RepID=UPI003FCC0962
MSTPTTLLKRGWTSTKNIYDRLTSSTPLVLYLCLTLLHSFIQIVLQLFVLSANFQSAHLLAHVADFSTAKDNTSWAYYGLICDPDGGRCFDATDMEGRGEEVAVVLGLAATESTSSSSSVFVPSSTITTSSPSPTSTTSTSTRTSATPLFSTAPPPTSTFALRPDAARQTQTFTFLSVIAGEVVPLTSVGVAPAPTATDFAAFRAIYGQDGRYDAEEVDSDGEEEDDESLDGSVSSASSEDGNAEDLERREFVREMVEQEGREKRGVVDSFLHGISKRSISLMPLSNGSLQITGLTTPHHENETTAEFLAAEAENDSVVVSQTCVRGMAVLAWGTKDRGREDVVLVFFMAWVAGMSIVAMLNESIPHVIAALLTHLLSTGWSAYQVSHTVVSHEAFHRVINGVCDGVSVLNAGYWERRKMVEIAILSLNILALFMSSYISWTLLRLYGWATFRNIGASIKINRYYKLVLSLSILLQLDFFFLLAWIVLWLDQLTQGPVAPFAKHQVLYRAIFGMLAAISVPWVVLGWKSVRKEWKIGMNVFLGLAVLMTIAWSSMFASAAFVATIRTWNFFTAISAFTFVLLIITIAFAVWCRFNFGKGLLEYLDNHRSLSDERTSSDKSSSSTHDDEKMFEIVSFDSDAKLVSSSTQAPRHYRPDPVAVPTFSSVFPSGPAPPPSKMFTIANSNSGGLQPPRRAQINSYASSDAPSWMPNDDVDPLGQRSRGGERRLTPPSGPGSFRPTESSRGSRQSNASSLNSQGTDGSVWKKEVLANRVEKEGVEAGIGSYESQKSMLSNVGSVGGGLRRYDGLEKGQGKEVWNID